MGKAHGFWERLSEEADLLSEPYPGQPIVEIAGDRQVLEVYEALTCWAVPALFMLWGMFALEGGKPHASACLLGLALPAFCLLVFWGAVYAVVSYLLAGGSLTLAGVWAALVSAARGNTYFHLWVLYPLIGLYLVHPVLHRFTASASRGEVRYFLGLCFLFANLLPLWAAFFPDSVIAAQLERLRVHLALGWAGCYVGGWYLRHYTIGRVPEFLLYILGVRTSSFVAGYLNFYLHLLSENVTLVQSNAAGEIFEQLLRIGPGDVMIAISFPRYSKVTMNTVKFARDRGATIVAITDNEISPVYQMAEAALLAPCEMISFVDSMVAPLSLINALLIAVGRRMRADVSRTFAELEGIWNEYGVFGKTDDE